MNQDALMRQAESMQRAMQALQKELQDTLVTGESRGGMVRVTLNGKFEAHRVEIGPAAQAQPSLLESLVESAFTDAAERVQALQQEKLSSVAQSLGLPPGFNPPLF